MDEQLVREIAEDAAHNAVAGIVQRLASIEAKLDQIIPLAEAFNALQDSPMAKMLGINNGDD